MSRAPAAGVTIKRYKKLIILTFLLFCLSLTILAKTPATRKIKGLLIDFQKEFLWFEDYEGSHFEGSSPMAKFKIINPKEHSGKKIGILFKQPKENDYILKDIEKSIGISYTFEIADDFFDKGYTNIMNINIDTKYIDDLNVKNLKKEP